MKQVEKELTKDSFSMFSIKDFQDIAAQRLKEINEGITLFLGRTETDPKEEDSVKAHRELATLFSNKYLPVCKKGRIYAIAAVAGNVLSIALIVSAFALRIFAKMRPILSYIAMPVFGFSILTYAVHAFYQGHQLYVLHKATKDLQEIEKLAKESSPKTS